MTREEGIKALKTIAEMSISNDALKNELTREISSYASLNCQLPVKGILAKINAHSDLTVSEETGELIRSVYFHFT